MTESTYTSEMYLLIEKRVNKIHHYNASTSRHKTILNRPNRVEILKETTFLSFLSIVYCYCFKVYFEIISIVRINFISIQVLSDSKLTICPEITIPMFYK